MRDETSSPLAQRPWRTLVYLLGVLLGLNACATAPTRSDAPGPAPSTPTVDEVFLRIGPNLTYEQALSHFGPPVTLVEPETTLFEARWERTYRGQRCELAIAFDAHTNHLVRWRFGCR